MGVDTFGINFGLRPLTEVVPWGDGDTGHTLQWFGLTDGWYDVVVGARRLYSAPEQDRGVEYHVSRLWEDLIEVAPYALDPVPDTFAARIGNVKEWVAWGDRVMANVDDLDLVERGLGWWWHRTMHGGPFANAPRLRLWGRGDAVHVHWDSAEPARARAQWSSPNGEAIVGLKAFRDELLTFNAKLLNEMKARIDAVQQRWERPEIAIALRELRREQAFRVQALERAFGDARRRAPSWDAALEALTELEARVGRINRTNGE